MSTTLTKLAEESKNVLGKVCSISLMFWYRQCITVEKSKVTITTRNLLGEEELFPMNFTDMLAVNYACNPFLATIYFQVKNDYNTPSPRKVTHLPVDQARKITELVTGLLIANKENADVDATHNTRRIANELQELGASEAVI